MISTSPGPPSTVSTQWTELQSVEARELVIRPSSEPEQMFEDRNLRNYRWMNGNWPRVPGLRTLQFQERPHTIPLPRPDFVIIHRPSKYRVSLWLA